MSPAVAATGFDKTAAGAGCGGTTSCPNCPQEVMTQLPSSCSPHKPQAHCPHCNPSTMKRVLPQPTACHAYGNTHTLPCYLPYVHTSPTHTCTVVTQSCGAPPANCCWLLRGGTSHCFVLGSRLCRSRWIDDQSISDVRRSEILSAIRCCSDWQCAGWVAISGWFADFLFFVLLIPSSSSHMC